MIKAKCGEIDWDAFNVCSGVASDNINEEIKGQIVYGITVEYKDKTIWEFKEIKELVDKKFKELSINKAVHEVCDSMLLKKVGHGTWELKK